MQPTLTQVPPSAAHSASATRAPRWPAMRAARTPPLPPPMTKRSKSKEEEEEEEEEGGMAGRWRGRGQGTVPSLRHARRRGAIARRRAPARLLVQQLRQPQ